MSAKNILRSMLFILIPVFTVSFSHLGWSQEVTEKTSSLKVASVEDIVNQANQVAYYQGDDGQAKVSMSITDSQGRIRYRRFTILRKDDNSEEKSFGDQKFYVYFHRPADVNKMVFLVWKNIDKDDDRWLYLPALDLVKRIAASDKRTSFVGSHFFYEDVSGRNINEDKHELEKTTENYYVLKNTPIKPELVEFSYYYMWIHRNTFLPIKVEYYDKNKEKYRVYEALKVEDVQGFKTVTKSRMKDLQSKEETVTEYSNVKYNIGLSEDIFTERYLRNAPAKYLR
ncbi:MAG: outer membrane lipoprotein-sorting protein [Thermodesulfobacteriota bacterium]|nr:outer membrane lipoprotein-sorting protein [Thermodesulfobacteriota bacterium]